MESSGFTFFFIFGCIVSIILLLFLISFMRFIALWFQAVVSGARVPFINIVGMSLRKISPRLIVIARITLYKAGLKTITTADLETHYLAGGNIIDVVRALIAADKANIGLSWRQATAIDLAGRDLLDAVKTSVNPKVIDCPDASPAHYIAAVAKNGVELRCRAKVTVRTNLGRLVGGATEETIVARVGEGIVNAIGSADNHADVLAAPQSISKLLLERRLDGQTAFEILSIDIAELTIGDAVGARLRTDQAEGDKRIAQAKAEERRALAVAMEHENKALVVAMKADVVKAEAAIPLALADALRTGRMQPFDYKRWQNIEADTSMRNTIGRPGEEDEAE